MKLHKGLGMAKHSELLDQLRAELGTTDCCALDAINSDTAISDLRLDSLALVSVIVRVAAAYEIALPGEEVASLLSASTVRELAVELERSLTEQLDSSKT